MVKRKTANLNIKSFEFFIKNPFYLYLLVLLLNIPIYFIFRWYGFGLQKSLIIISIYSLGSIFYCKYIYPAFGCTRLSELKKTSKSKSSKLSLQPTSAINWDKLFLSAVSGFVIFTIVSFYLLDFHDFNLLEYQNGIIKYIFLAVIFYCSWYYATVNKN